MLNKKNIVLAVSLMALPLVSQTAFAAVAAKSNLSDWLTKSSGEFTDASDVKSSVDKFVIEDGLDAQHGGQKYDAEAMYVEFDDTSGAETLYVAIVTGLRKGFSGSSDYFSGDILFDIDQNADDGYEFAMTTYNAGGDGNVSQISGASAGDLFEVDSWQYGIWGPSDFKTAHPTVAKTGTEVTDISTDLTYNRIAKDAGDLDNIFSGYNNGNSNYSGYYNNHYMISAAIDLSGASSAATQLLAAITGQGSSGLGIHWTPTCNNDYIHTSITEVGSNTPDTPKVPEPASLALMGLGMFGLVGFRRKMKA